MKDYCFTCGQRRKLLNAICKECRDSWPYVAPEGGY